MMIAAKTFNKNEIIQTEVEVENVKEPVSTLLPLDTFKIEKVLVQPVS